MSDWKKYILNDLTEKIGSGATPRGGKEAYKSEGISLIRSQNILDFNFSEDGLAYIDEVQAEKLKNVIVEENDVLINITGDSVARVCMAPSSFLPARVNQHVSILRASKDILESYYLKYFLLSPRNKAKLLMLASSGATRNALTKSMLESFKIDLPPLPEQKAIAHILGKLDDKIELNRQMNQTLEEMAQALFNSWFVDFDPVFDNLPAEQAGALPDALRTKYEKRKLVPDEKKLIHKNPELAKLFPSQFTFNENLDKWIPEGWEVNKIRNVGKIVTGKTPSSKNPEQFGDIYPFVTPTDFKNYFKIVTSAERNLSQEGFNKNHNRILPKDSVIVTCIGSDMGKIAMNKVKCLTNQQINSVVSNNKLVSSEYLYHFFKWSYDLLRNLAFGGSTMPILNKTDFGNIDIIIPPLELINSANKAFKRFDDKILNNVKETETLTQLRDTLLPQLISGKVRVPEKVVERFEKIKVKV